MYKLLDLIAFINTVNLGCMSLRRLGALVIGAGLLVLVACSPGGPPMIEVVPESSASPSEACSAAFSALEDVDQIDERVEATLQQCTLEEWHQMSVASQVDWPVAGSTDPGEALAVLCEDAERSQARVCVELAAG